MSNLQMNTSENRPLVISAVIPSKSDAQVLACYFLEVSQWFAVIPLPEEEYEFEVKIENKAMLENAILKLVI